jgi:hypothetical protein
MNLTRSCHWRNSIVTCRRYLGLSLLIGSVAAFLYPNLSQSSIHRQQKWGMNCPKVHSSTISALSTEINLDADYEADIPAFESEKIDDPGSRSDLADLCNLLDATPMELLRLQMTSDGVRGVFLNRPVKENDVVLSIPIESCLTDDFSPSWLQLDPDQSSDNPSSWATRLGANLLDLYLRIRIKPEMKLTQWVSLLPEKEYLKASLPVHWADDTVLSAKSTAIELGVDSAFFARAEATEDLLVSLRASEIARGISEEELRDMCSNALDVVQTRSCRLSKSTGSPVGVLAPIFDFINHGSTHSSKDSAANVQSGMEGNQLVVRALSDLQKDEEVLVDYGESARPAWKCLLSYGFVPDFKADTSTDEDRGGDSEHLAEIFIDGTRYEVGPSFIPFEIVEKMAAKLHVGTRVEYNMEDPELALTPEIAEKISQRISQVAYHLLLEPETDLYDDHPAVTPTPFQVISNRLSSSLRVHQYRVLLACATGLKQYVEDGDENI